MYRVSVLIPAYNASVSIEKAIISVLTQTEQNFEIIVIDDCSTDETAKIVEVFCKEDNRVKYIRLSNNRGRSCALNFGSDKATGKWIAVLDADDWYAEGRLKSLLDIADSHNVTMVADNQIFMDMQAQKISGTAFRVKGRSRNFSLKEFLSKSDPLSLFDYGMLKPIILAEFIKNNSISYYEPARNGQDFYYLLSFFAAGGTAIIMDEPSYYYAQPFGSLSRKNRQHAGGHYNFEQIKQINAHFIKIYKNQFSEEYLDFLHKRGRGFQALISFHTIRAYLSRYEIREIFVELLHTNSEFLRLIATRSLQRGLRKIRHPHVFLDD